MIQKLKKLFSVPDTFDPDELRMRQIINIILVAFAIFAFLGLSILVPAFGFDSLQTFLSNSGVDYILKSGLTSLLATLALFLLNRWKRAPRNLAGSLFVLMTIASIVISDDPVQLVNGRSLMFWTLPIVLTVVVLPPAFVYLTDVVVIALMIVLTSASYSDLWSNLNIYAISGIAALSVMAWLGMEVANRSIRAARAEAGKNAAILNGVADGVVVVNQDGKVISANPAALHLVNGQMQSLLGAQQSEIGGRIIQLNWSDVQGVGRVAVVRDVSRQVEIERAKDAMLAVVSHEMRTPLSAISGFAELIITSDLPTAKAMANRIFDNTQRLAVLVNDLLDQAQIQAGALKLRREPYLPALLADSVQKLLSETARKKNVDLTVVADGLPEKLVGDVDRVQQILINLVGNAIKFTEPGGKVEVSLLPSSGSRWRILVQDTGIGIPPERLPDIFEPFRRGSDYATRQHQGAGLGLSIVKQLTKLMNGDVAVVSVVNQGSTFTVTLPLETVA